LSKGEILNCELTDEAPGALDEYNSYHFYESAVTDFYERGANCAADDEDDDDDDEKDDATVTEKALADEDLPDAGVGDLRHDKGLSPDTRLRSFIYHDVSLRGLREARREEEEVFHLTRSLFFFGPKGEKAPKFFNLPKTSPKDERTLLLLLLLHPFSPNYSDPMAQNDSRISMEVGELGTPKGSLSLPPPSFKRFSSLSHF